jgi:hypothetical protein
MSETADRRFNSRFGLCTVGHVKDDRKYTFSILFYERDELFGTACRRND